MAIFGGRSIIKKRRTREHVISDLSVNHFERQALLCGYSVERISKDYGHDLVLMTYNVGGEPDGGEIWVQLKATDNLHIHRDGGKISCRIQLADIARWVVEPMPVILVVYDAQRENAYWLYVQAHFEKEPASFHTVKSGKITMHLPKANVLNADAMRTFAMFRDDVVNQFSGVIKHHE